MAIPSASYFDRLPPEVINQIVYSISLNDAERTCLSTTLVQSITQEHYKNLRTVNKQFLKVADRGLVGFINQHQLPLSSYFRISTKTSLFHFLTHHGKFLHYFSTPGLKFTGAKCNKIIQACPHLKSMQLDIQAQGNDEIQIKDLPNLEKLNLNIRNLSQVAFQNEKLHHLAISCLNKSLPYEKLATLKELTIYHADKIETVDLDALPLLEKIKLTFCGALQKMHSSTPHAHLMELAFSGINQSPRNDYDEEEIDHPVEILVNYVQMPALKRVVCENSSAVPRPPFAFQVVKQTSNTTIFEKVI